MSSTRLVYVSKRPSLNYLISANMIDAAEEKSVREAQNIACKRLSKLTSLSYNTRSNRVRIIKTPGGKLRYLHIKKRGSPPKCGDCGIKLPGVSWRSVPEAPVQGIIPSESFRHQNQESD